MNQERKEQLVTLWIDDQLSDAERAEWDAAVASDPSMLEEAKAAKNTMSMLKSEIPATQEPPYADFFNSQIQKRIREENSANLQNNPGTAATFSLDGILNWLRSPLTLASAAAVAIALFVNGFGPGDADAPVLASNHTVVETVFTPDSAINVTSKFDEYADAHVILLDGIDAIPEDVEIRGKSVASWAPATKFGPARFFDADGKLAYVLHPTPTGLPHFLPFVRDI
ncbi:MAG: hypothetical protein AAGA58_13680 [Verrucomicrobiota bacterium]